MLMSDSKTTKWMQYACALMLALLVLLQFMPFWNLGDEAGTETSINSYVWFPESNKDTGKYLEANIENFSISTIVPTNVLIWVLGAGGIALAVFLNGHVATSAVHVLAGVCGMWGYLRQPALQLGGNWMLHLALCIATVVCGALGTAAAVREIREFRADGRAKKE